MFTHWGRVTHTCIDNQVIIGLLPGQRQAIICANAGILSIGVFRINFKEILVKIHIFPFQKMQLKRLSTKWRSFYLGLNVLRKFPPHKCSHLQMMEENWANSSL